MWAVSMPQKSSWDKLRGERFFERVGTLGGDGLSVLGVTTLGSNGALVISQAWIVVCDLVWRGGGMGKAKIGFYYSARHLRGLTVGGAAWSVEGGVCCNLNLKISASSVSAKMVTSPTWVNGTSGWEFCKASVMSLAVMINLSVEDNCGIW
jgi:hypothetical protein